MTASRKLSLALGFALAIPAAAYAYDGGSSLSHHYYSRPHHGIVAYRTAAAPRLRTGNMKSRGLTRNPDVCAKYGCIGSND